MLFIVNQVIRYTIQLYYSAIIVVLVSGYMNNVVEEVLLMLDLQPQSMVEEQRHIHMVGKLAWIVGLEHSWLGRGKVEQLALE